MTLINVKSKGCPKAGLSLVDQRRLRFISIVPFEAVEAALLDRVTKR
jgi:hypothetical protein